MDKNKNNTEKLQFSTTRQTPKTNHTEHVAAWLSG